MPNPIPVVCAIILEEGRLFCAQREAGGSLALKWEVPGGKIVAGEDPVLALYRELKEELNWEIEAIDVWPPMSTITLHLWLSACIILYAGD